jgi:tRNA(fMet)-specific endonuclease VapC
MMWLPDTNVWVNYLNPQPSPVKTRFLQRAPSKILLCDVVKAELYYGAYKSTRQHENLILLATLFGQFGSLPFNGEAARAFGEIRADLTRKGTPIGPYDLQIAAIALVNRLTLVTHNTREFSHIASLNLEDWEI